MQASLANPDGRNRAWKALAALTGQGFEAAFAVRPAREMLQNLAPGAIEALLSGQGPHAIYLYKAMAARGGMRITQRIGPAYWQWFAQAIASVLRPISPG